MTNWLSIRESLPADVSLVAVSKYHPIEQVAEAYAEGCRDFGESRVQELKLKQAALPKDIRWHFIGHLQTNKVRDLLRLRPYLIQSVDSEHLLRAINDEAQKQGIIQNVLLELHVAREETKSGFSIDEFKQWLNDQINDKIVNGQMVNYPHVNVRGLMCMATNTDDEQEIRRCFHLTASVARGLTGAAGLTSNSAAVISMGMSDDYQIAICEGSTMVRLGSAIFGNK